MKARSEKYAIDSQTIIEAIRRKHEKDLFIPECKIGESCAVGCLRFDAWVMRKSWAHPCTTGYEIKVARNDFMRDEKWTGYLPYCNEFYFVSPPNVIQPNEVPDDVGLLWTTANGEKLYTKKKAKYRNVSIPDSIWRYILMWRTKVTRDEYRSDGREYWEHWLEKRNIDRIFGGYVGKSIRKSINDRIIAVESENERLKGLFNKYDEVIDFLQLIGVNPGSFSMYMVENKTRVIDVLPRDIEDNIRRAASDLVKLRRRIRTIRSSLKTH